MSNLIIWTNNASSLLASSITNSSTTVTVTAGQGSLFPVISAGEYSVATLEDTSGNIEVVFITGRTTDTMTITRAQEGTTALSFASGSRFELRVTAGVLATLLQKTGADTLSGTTNVTGVLALGSGGSIQGGEFTGVLRGAPGVTGNQIAVPANGTSPVTMGGSPILTTSNLVANLPSGVGVNLTGMVMFWSGASNNIPAGYVLCDGTAGTPNLRDQFIVGGGGSLPTTGGSNPGSTGATDPSGSQVIAGTALTIDQIPSHGHAFYTNVTTYSSNGHPAVIGVDAGGSYQTNIPVGAGGPPANTPFIQTTGGSGGAGSNTVANTHTHTLSGGLSHTHTITLPPYRAVFAIMKT